LAFVHPLTPPIGRKIIFLWKSLFTAWLIVWQQTLFFVIDRASFSVPVTTTAGKKGIGGPVTGI
jgi:hypothetical protein